MIIPRIETPTNATQGNSTIFVVKYVAPPKAC